MDEILRYIWLHGTERAASEILVYSILIVVAVGSIIKSRLFVLRDIDAIVAAGVVAIIVNVLLLLSAILPYSPLLGVTGTLYPSPWLTGLCQSLCLEAIFISLVFGLVSGSLSSLRDVLSLFTYGISRWPWVIILALILSLFVNDR